MNTFDKKAIDKFISLSKKHHVLHKDGKTLSQIRSELKDALENKNDKCFIYKVLDNDIAYFIHAKHLFHQQFQQNIISLRVYCKNNSALRKSFYKRINKVLHQFDKKSDSVIIKVYANDKSMNRRFKKNWFASTTIGKMNTLYKATKDISIEDFKIKKIKKSELKHVSELELEAHRKTPSSVMHKVFKSKNANKMILSFYKSQALKRGFLVCKRKDEIVGCIGTVLDKKHSFAGIMTIFVSKKYQGQGISKILYKSAIEKMKKENIKYLFGYSSTDSVLKYGKKIGRLPVIHSYKFKYTKSLKI